MQCFLEGKIPRADIQNAFVTEGDSIKLVRCGCWADAVHLRCGLDGDMGRPVKCQVPGKPCKL